MARRSHNSRRNWRRPNRWWYGSGRCTRAARWRILLPTAARRRSMRPLRIVPHRPGLCGTREQNPESVSRGRSGFFRRIVVADVAHMHLFVELQADPRDQVELGLEEVDMTFLILHQRLEQVARHVILDAVTVEGGLLIKVARAMLCSEVALHDLLDVLTDAQRVEHLHVREAIKEQDAVGEAIGVMHFLDRFLAPLLGQFLQAPMVQKAEMNPILVDGREFAPQSLVQIVDNLRITLHSHSSYPETGLPSNLERF